MSSCTPSDPRFQPRCANRSTAKRPRPLMEPLRPACGDISDQQLSSNLISSRSFQLLYNTYDLAESRIFLFLSSFSRVKVLSQRRGPIRLQTVPPGYDSRFCTIEKRICRSPGMQFTTPVSRNCMLSWRVAPRRNHDPLCPHDVVLSWGIMPPW